MKYAILNLLLWSPIQKVEQLLQLPKLYYKAGQNSKQK